MREKLGYCERWVLGYLRANPNGDNTAPEIATALQGLGVITGNNGGQRVRYALRQLERRRLAVREQVGRTVVLWEPA